LRQYVSSHAFVVLVSAALISISFLFFFFFNHTPTTQIYTLSLHDALPIFVDPEDHRAVLEEAGALAPLGAAHHLLASDLDLVARSEEHTSELQSRVDLVCRLLLEKKNKTQ